ncbi:MAG TPA: hypothetical protein VFE94_03320 [Candidatus Paceibacterota bacterium]|nr:hypothetical protein [Candidatus Paceibacterota bacterium]
MTFRFSNSFLQDSWNANAIESIRIELLEKDGVGARGGFYEGIGALRDVGQNHLLQLLALLCMDNPGGFGAELVRKKRAELLESLEIFGKGEVAKKTVRGQYEGYRREKDVDPNSQTETYFRIEASLNTDKWRGVPIYLEGGKAMKEEKVEATITFRHPTPCLCPPEQGKHYKNVLYYRIQPKEGIHIVFWVKKPGPKMVVEEKEFAFDYKAAFGGEEFLDAYVRLLHNVIQGDQTLFVSTEEIMAEWKFVDPILRAWQKGITPLTIYQKNTMP